MQVPLTACKVKLSLHGMSTFGAGWWEHTNFCTSIHNEAETLVAVHDEEKATWDQARDAKAKYFTVFDALKGYHQCPLDEESQKLTTFITPFGRHVSESTIWDLFYQ